jgi:hypothetical protein
LHDGVVAEARHFVQRRVRVLELAAAAWGGGARG